MKITLDIPANKIFVTADLHFGHANIIKYTGRPYKNVSEMDQALQHNWNQVVNKDAVVFILGDFSFQRHSQYASQLNGRKYLILGNHDKERDAYEAKKSGHFIDVDDYCELSASKKKFILFHYAIRQWNKKHHGSIHLFGHSHGKLEPHGWSFDVGVDAWDYYPISIAQVLGHIKTLEPDFSHHH